MKTIMTIFIIAIGGALSMCCSLFGSILPLNEVDDEKSFAITDVKMIRMDMSSESIRIYRAESGEEVRFHYYGSCWPERHMVAELSDGRISVRAPGACIMSELRLDVYLPADYHGGLDIKAASGSVSMEAVDLADFRLEAASGSFSADSIKAPAATIRMSSGSLKIQRVEAQRLEVDNNSGSIHIGPCACAEAAIKASAGSVTLESVQGNVEVANQSGSIMLREAGGDSDLRTASGSIRLGYAEFAAQRVKASTNSGSITLDLPADAGFSLEARTSSGRVRSDFPVTVEGDTERSRLSGVVASGAGSVSLTSGSGNITINAAR